MFPATQVVFTLSQIIVDHHGPGDPEKLPKEIVLKRAADLAEALYSMPRLVLETSMEPWSMKMTMSLEFGLSLEIQVCVPNTNLMI